MPHSCLLCRECSQEDNERPLWTKPRPSSRPPFLAPISGGLLLPASPQLSHQPREGWFGACTRSDRHKYHFGSQKRFHDGGCDQLSARLSPALPSSSWSCPKEVSQPVSQSSQSVCLSISAVSESVRLFNTRGQVEPGARAQEQRTRPNGQLKGQVSVAIRLKLHSC